MSFELKAFTKANEKIEYEKECTEKLLHIRNTRERQAAVAYQSGMMPQTGAGPNQIPAAFPQHIPVSVVAHGGTQGANERGRMLKVER